MKGEGNEVCTMQCTFLYIPVTVCEIDNDDVIMIMIPKMTSKKDDTFHDDTEIDNIIKFSRTSILITTI